MSFALRGYQVAAVDAAERERRRLRSAASRAKKHAEKYGVGAGDMRGRHGNHKRDPRSPEERFWSHVERGEGCWIWTASKRSYGYGQYNFEGRPRPANRVAWQIVNGSIPPGLLVLHRCDNPACVRVAPCPVDCSRLRQACLTCGGHLFLGSQADNLADMSIKGRGAIGDRNGSRTMPERLAFGERNGSARLTAAQALEVFTSTEHRSVLAARYGVHQNTIDDIRSGRRWSRVTGA